MSSPLENSLVRKAGPETAGFGFCWSKGLQTDTEPSTGLQTAVMALEGLR